MSLVTPVNSMSVFAVRVAIGMLPAAHVHHQMSPVSFGRCLRSLRVSPSSFRGVVFLCDLSCISGGMQVTMSTAS